VLKGDKVVLRPMREEDIARQHEFNQDPELYQLDCALPRVSSWEMARAFYESRTRYDENIAPFALEADGTYIGYCSLMHLRHRYGNLELGIMIGDRAYWGRGYGRDAVRVLLDYGFRALGARRIALTTHAKNERAIRCYLACGFVEEGRPRQAVWVDGAYVDLVEMAILRGEWESRRAVAPAGAAPGG
jgi:RimJ/RimL family protein N-acetyltransferase